MALTIRSIGTSARDYSSVTAAVADIGVGLSAADDLVFEIYNDTGAAIAESAFTVPSLTGSLTLRPAVGSGALGHPNDHRTRGPAAVLDYDPAVGAALEFAGTFAAMMTVNAAQLLTIQGLQFSTTGSRARPFNISNTNAASRIEDCIVKQSHNLTNFSTVNISTQNNNVWVSASDDRDIIHVFSAAITIKNNTFVNTGAQTAAIRAVNKTGGSQTLTITNSVHFGFNNPPLGTGGVLVLTNNATDLTAAAFGGTGTIGSLVPSDQLENATFALFDGRAKSTGALPDAADAASATATDILGQTRDASPTIGAWELVFSGQPVEESLTLALAAGADLAGHLVVEAALALGLAAGDGLDPAAAAEAAIVTAQMASLLASGEAQIEATVTVAGSHAVGVVGGQTVEAALAAALAAGLDAEVGLAFTSLVELGLAAGLSAASAAEAAPALTLAAGFALQALAAAAIQAGVTIDQAAGLQVTSDAVGVGFQTPDGRSVRVVLRVDRSVIVRD